MKTPEKTTLPVPSLEYVFNTQQTIHRTIEQSFDDLRIDVVSNRDHTSKPAALAQRRQQFLLMGA